MELDKLTDAIVAGNMPTATALVNEAVAANVAPQEIISTYLIKGMETIGARFGAGQAFVPNLLMSARAMKGCLEILFPGLNVVMVRWIGFLSFKF